MPKQAPRKIGKDMERSYVATKKWNTASSSPKVNDEWANIGSTIILSNKTTTFTFKRLSSAVALRDIGVQTDPPPIIKRVHFKEQNQNSRKMKLENVVHDGKTKTKSKRNNDDRVDTIWMIC